MTGQLPPMRCVAETTFVVGQRVCVVNDDSTYYGQHGVVRAVLSEDLTYPIIVKLDRETRGEVDRFHPDELAAEAKPPQERPTR
jgi:hypothetical protein